MHFAMPPKSSITSVTTQIGLPASPNDMDGPLPPLAATVTPRSPGSDISNELDTFDFGFPAPLTAQPEQPASPTFQTLAPFPDMEVLKFCLRLPFAYSTDSTTGACILCKKYYYPRWCIRGPETSVKLPCGCLIGHHCAWQWFGSKESGRKECPACRVPLLGDNGKIIAEKAQDILGIRFGPYEGSEEEKKRRTKGVIYGSNNDGNKGDVIAKQARYVYESRFEDDTITSDSAKSRLGKILAASNAEGFKTDSCLLEGVQDDWIDIADVYQDSAPRENSRTERNGQKHFGFATRIIKCLWNGSRKEMGKKSMSMVANF